MRLLTATVLTFYLLTCCALAGPSSSHLALTFPDTGTYTYWIQAKSGTISVLPITVSHKGTVSVAGTVSAGDVLCALDAHTGQVATSPVAAGAKGGVQPIMLHVSDFKSLSPALPGGNVTVSPASTVPDKNAAAAGGFGRLMVFIIGLIVLGGVIWMIRRMIVTRGEPLAALARKAGVEIVDPVEIDKEANAPLPVYTPPAQRPLDVVPDAATAPPRAGVQVGPALNLPEIPQLVGLQGLVAGSMFTLSDPLITIGRDGDNTIVLAENTVSRHHAQLVRERSGKIMLIDESSANGVYVNGERVQRAALQAGDEVKIGDNYFRFEG